MVKILWPKGGRYEEKGYYVGDEKVAVEQLRGYIDRVVSREVDLLIIVDSITKKPS